VYELTHHGYNHANKLFPKVSPLFSPANAIEKVNYKLYGKYNSEDLFVERRGRQFVSTIGNKYFTNTAEACRRLGFDTKGRSAPRILYNLAIKNKFKAG
jgi:hypothetical protein